MAVSTAVLLAGVYAAAMDTAPPVALPTGPVLEGYLSKPPPTPLSERDKRLSSSFLSVVLVLTFDSGQLTGVSS